MTAVPQPRRPFGVILALAGGVFIFCVIPLLMLATILYLSTYIQTDPTGGASGIDFTHASFQPLILPAVSSIVYLLLAIWAWRGKPSVARFVFPLVTAFYCIVTWGLLTIPQLNTDPGIDSGTAVLDTASQIYLFAMIGITIYITWFMNRWSARAFYRGYYTKNDLQLLEAARSGTAS